MLRKKSSSAFSPVSSISSSRSRSPTPADWDADDELGTMSGDEATSSRPTPITVPSRHSPSCSAKRPSLKEILSNTSPPPWTLTAFMAYLSNNHCLETLEFTMDAARYRKHYQKIVAKGGEQALSPESKDAANMKVLWQRLIEAYIRPNGSREINIPSEVRDPILHYDISTKPPAPEALDLAVTKVYELMEESVLVPFLNSMSPAGASPSTGCDCQSPEETEVTSPREGGGFLFRKSRFTKYSPPSSSSPTESPTIGFPAPPQSGSNRKSVPVSLTTAMHRHRLSNRLSPTSSVNASQSSPNPGDIAGPGLTDDSGYTSSHTNESIMTPPMSPPDDDVLLSPRSARENGGGWKKLGRLSSWKPNRKKSQQNFSAKDVTESLP